MLPTVCPRRASKRPLVLQDLAVAGGLALLAGILSLPSFKRTARVKFTQYARAGAKSGASDAVAAAAGYAAFVNAAIYALLVRGALLSRCCASAVCAAASLRPRGRLWTRQLAAARVWLRCGCIAALPARRRSLLTAFTAAASLMARPSTPPLQFVFVYSYAYPGALGAFDALGSPFFDTWPAVVGASLLTPAVALFAQSRARQALLA